MSDAEAPAVEVAEPADKLLLDDLTVPSDLKVKVTEAWHEFARALAGVIQKLDAGVHVDLTLDPTASGTGHAVYEVSIQRHEEGVIGALAVSNAGLPEGHRLDRSAVAEMIIIGWSPPGVVEGSGKDFGMIGQVGEAARFAVTITKTLRDVYGAPHPAFLTYTAHDDADADVIVAPLGTARSRSTKQAEREFLRLDEDGFAALEDPQMSLAERVAIVVAGVQRITPDQLQVDSDGDIGIRSGSAMVFVRIRENPSLVDVFSPILTDIEASEKLYGKLSNLTTKMPIGRLYFANKTVWASVPVFGRDFQPTHLMLAVQVMTGLADELDDRLHGEFGGKRFFVEGDTPAVAEEKPNEELRTGMYL
jgi:type III secretion system-like peptide-binding chaperone